jgi:hypothetical protein
MSAGYEPGLYRAAKKDLTADKQNGGANVP